MQAFDAFRPLLAPLRGGKVLDVATGGGAFAAVLADCLADYAEITGVDSSEKAASAFAGNLEGKRARYVKADALSLPFPDSAFDTVAISNSLHHFARPESVLAEMKRVLKDGGTFIVSEMFRDCEGEAEATHTLLHDWWGEIDSASGVTHRPTFAKAELIDLVTSTFGPCLESATIVEDTDPHAAETIAEVEDTIEFYVSKCPGISEGERLAERGKELSERVRRFGFRNAAVHVFIGFKK